jgi:hypothetical protein
MRSRAEGAGAKPPFAKTSRGARLGILNAAGAASHPQTRHRFPELPFDGREWEEYRNVFYESQ